MAAFNWTLSKVSSEYVLEKCTCRNSHKDVIAPVVVSEVIKAVEGMENDPRVLSVIRNGGWELWFRNALLMCMERNRRLGSIGFNEEANGSRRADLLFRCLSCDAVLFAAEVKTNFFSQPNEVPKMIRGALGQLKHFVDAEVSGFLIYTITHLWHEGNAPYAEKHNRAVRTRYKTFRSHSADTAEKEAREDMGPLLPKSQEVARCRLSLRGAHAIVRVWLMRVTREDHPLAFLNGKGEVTERKDCRT